MENEQLNRSLELFNEFAEKGIDFVMEQSPLLCEEIIVRAQIISLSQIFICLLIVLALLCAAIKAWRNKEALDITTQNERNGFAFCLGLVFILCSIMPIGFIMEGFYTFVVSTFTPRLYLFEYFRKLIS
jgi:hypothetical protein